MPNRDGTGPMGQGAFTGRGLGECVSGSRPIYGRGLGLGFGRGSNCRRANNAINTSSKVLLSEKKAILEARIEAINKQLNK